VAGPGVDLLGVSSVANTLRTRPVFPPKPGQQGRVAHTLAGTDVPSSAVKSGGGWLKVARSCLGAQQLRVSPETKLRPKRLSNLSVSHNSAERNSAQLTEESGLQAGLSRHLAHLPQIPHSAADHFQSETGAVKDGNAVQAVFPSSRFISPLELQV
jgi:hypothetical protein